MATNDFFEEDKVDETTQTQEPELIKLGDKEYSTEELNRLVGLGQQAVELETRWDTKLDRLMPEFSKAREEVKTLKQQQEELSRAQTQTKQSQGEELSDEEQARIIKENAKKYGLMTDDEFDTKYASRRAGEKLLEKTESVISQAGQEGYPKTTVEELLTYMGETGVRDPQTAYEVMFKKELKEIEYRKLQELKPNGLQTQSGSTAGAKTPSPVTVTKDNMGDLLTAVLTRGGGQ